MPKRASSCTISMTLELRDIGHVLLEGDAEDGDQAIGAIAQREAAHAFARDPLAHAVVDATARQHDLRMIAGLFRAIGQVIRIDADAVAADQAGVKLRKFHLVEAAASTSPVSMPS